MSWVTSKSHETYNISNGWVSIAPVDAGQDAKRGVYLVAKRWFRSSGCAPQSISSASIDSIALMVFSHVTT